MNIAMLYVYNQEERETVPLYRAYVEQKAKIIKNQVVEVRGRVGAGPESKAVEVQGELAEGYPAEEILHYADEKGIDLILMATHGRSGVKRWIMGSVADKILHASNVPVWLVRAGVTEKIRYDKWPKITILVPLDGSALAEAVLPHVEVLARQTGAEPVDVVLLMVCEAAVTLGYYPPSARFETPAGAVHVMPQDYERAEIAEQKLLAEQYLARVEKRLESAGLNVRSEVLAGEPAEQIVDYGSKNPFNLIVMSTHARSGLGRWVFGSVASKVLQGASSPIFLVRPRQSDSDQA
jgi:nucleotide-binding universal stress UspA family protein